MVFTNLRVTHELRYDYVQWFTQTLVGLHTMVFSNLGKVTHGRLNSVMDFWVHQCDEAPIMVSITHTQISMTPLCPWGYGKVSLI